MLAQHIFDKLASAQLVLAQIMWAQLAFLVNISLGNIS